MLTHTHTHTHGGLLISCCVYLVYSITRAVSLRLSVHVDGDVKASHASEGSNIVQEEIFC